MNSFKGLYDIRDAKLEDRNFVLATFLRGLYYGDSWFSKIPKDIFMDNYKHIAETLLSDSTIKIACLKDDPDVILGYSILSNDYQTVHWVYVKSKFRRSGVGSALTPTRPTVFSHLTIVGESLMKKYPTAIFNPFKLN